MTDHEKEVAEARVHAHRFGTNCPKGDHERTCKYPLCNWAGHRAWDRFEAAVRASERADRHVRNCRCCPEAEKPYRHIGVPFCRSEWCRVQVVGHPIVDDRCQRMREAGGR